MVPISARSAEDERVSGLQVSGYRDFRLEEFRYRASGFRRFYRLVEFRLVRSRNSGRQTQMTLGD